MLPDKINRNHPSDLADLLDYLRQKLSGSYSHIDPHLLDASIEDALLHYWDHPEGFDASRGVPLFYYLVWRTRHYLSKRLQKVKRHRHHENAVGVSEKKFEKIVSEVTGRGGIYLGKDGTEQEGEERQEETEKRRETLYGLLPLLNSHDRYGVYLFILGAAHEEWVEHLRIECLPPKEQQRKVNLEKDRLKKRLKRWTQKMQGGARSQDRTQVPASCFDAGGERESWLMQLRIPSVQQVDGFAKRMRSRASCSLVSDCCCS